MILGLTENGTPWFVTALAPLVVVGAVVWTLIEIELILRGVRGLRRGVLRRLFTWYR